MAIDDRKLRPDESASPTASVAPDASASGTSAPAVVWKPLKPLGQAEVIRGLGGIVSPLLAGFSLAAIATLLTASSPPRLTEFSIAAFAMTVGFLLFAMQFAFTALRYTASPSERLEWRPEITATDESSDSHNEAVILREMQEIREEQALDFAITKLYMKRTAQLYDLGLLAFTIGLVLLLVPAKWTIGRTIAVSAAGVAGLLEIYWIYGHFLNRWRFPESLYKRFLPLRKDIKHRKEMKEDIAPTAISNEEALAIVRSKQG
jgi:hypothetical protein